jgi:hypothetical protein
LGGEVDVGWPVSNGSGADKECGDNKMMQGVTLDMSGQEDITLLKLLLLTRQRVPESYWKLSYLDCSLKTQELYQLEEKGELVHISELVRVADSVIQVTEGCFESFLPGAAKPWAAFEYIDNRYLRCRSTDFEFLSTLKALGYDFHDLMSRGSIRGMRKPTDYRNEHLHGDQLKREQAFEFLPEVSLRSIISSVTERRSLIGE